MAEIVEDWDCDFLCFLRVHGPEQNRLLGSANFK